MTNTKAEPGYFDGLQRAEADEPVFPLRAHDVLADGLVSDWSDRKRGLILKAFEAGEIDAAKRDLELEQCRDADAIAMDMIAWRKGQAEAEPVETGGKPTYSGHAKTEEEIAAKALYDLTVETVRQLDNATALASEAAGAKLPDWDAGAVTVLTYAGSLLKAVADHIRPKRRSYAVGDALPGAFNVGALPHPNEIANEREKLLAMLEEVVRDDGLALLQLEQLLGPEAVSTEAAQKALMRKGALARIKGEVADPDYLAPLSCMTDEDRKRLLSGDFEDAADGGPGRTSIKKSLRAEGRNFIG